MRSESINGSGVAFNSAAQRAIALERWAPADTRRSTRERAPYVPDRSSKPEAETLAEGIQRKWNRLLKAREAHTGKSRTLYADRFSHLAAVRGGNPLDTINTIMARFSSGASTKGISLEMPTKKPEPVAAISVIGEDGYIKFKHGQNT